MHPLRGPYGCLPRALSALPSGQSPWDPVPRLHLVPDQFEVWLPWFLGEEFAALRAAEEATPLIPADIAAAATEANRVALLAAQSMPKFRSDVERDLYEEARATQAALESGLAQIRSSLRRLRTEQESVPALLGELVAAVGKLPTAAAPAVAPTRGDGRKEGEDGEVGAAYGA
ncbi:hypothetical protein GMDG_02806 [Pseudogymnoascus destructans 20631-21]|uniref:Uncharacterized protein n=1 Tax=Pseudogymnoascus destructans (strain ATCC MYA-4855 / 20631-21) TaxID=658429 RepID=L8G475_PSED2|nr:hypothetical protein GMDG_02806 [Pseudogymnoascus destructans 20631-21]